MAPDRNIVPIPKNAHPDEALQIYIIPLVRYYQDILEKVKKFRSHRGEVDREFFLDLHEYLLNTGWFLIYDYEVKVDILTDKAVKRLKEPLRKLNWGLSTRISITEYPHSQELANVTIADFLRSNSARQVKLASKRQFASLFQDWGLDSKILEATYKELYDISDPARKDRSNDVIVRPPEVKQDVYGHNVLIYNFKSANSTTGQRQKGYITFLADDLDDVESNSPVEVYCSCPDYKYRWFYTNWKSGSAEKPDDPKNRRPPVQTNPNNNVGMCKHLLAAHQYISGIEFV